MSENNPALQMLDICSTCHRRCKKNYLPCARGRIAYCFIQELSFGVTFESVYGLKVDGIFHPSKYLLGPNNYHT